MELKELSKKFDSVTNNLQKLLDQQESEIKNFGETTSRTAKVISEVEGQIKEIGGEMKELQSRADELEKKMGRPNLGVGNQQRTKSFGQVFVDSESYKRMRESNLDSSDPVHFKGLFNMRRKGLTGAEGIPVPTRVPNIIMPPEQELNIRDLLNVQTTDSNSIEYVREVGYTNNANAIGVGSPAPESSIEFTKESANVRDISHYIPVPNQALDDAKQLRGYIDNRLIYGLKQEDERQILYGDGASPNLQGILTDPDRQQYKWSQGKVGDTKIDTLRRAITIARMTGFPVTGVVVNPSDWEEIELLKGSDGHYIWVQVTEGGQKRTWSVPVVETIQINAGEVALGAWGMGAILWDRQDAFIKVLDQHADFGIRNMSALMANERVALTTMLPESFVHVTFDSKPTES
ncbi:HK97 family phage major capsid protein [Orenia metallireducens]|uniref:Phage major capsid protein, HK97 family n=1 Tax=Orenia metallireducens TaxID=1413210 RepID=A0A285IIK8_9FIRM|nr:phage major capsid protein [Orenia metallireducens]PRX16931.1 HK97 family phage major capsid protein [Orenia metallireducens]SNY47809.1 phage major capsid protein, HK97 family [Orenia metallireducens]